MRVASRDTEQGGAARVDPGISLAGARALGADDLRRLRPGRETEAAPGGPQRGHLRRAAGMRPVARRSRLAAPPRRPQSRCRASARLHATARGCLPRVDDMASTAPTVCPGCVGPKAYAPITRSYQTEHWPRRTHGPNGQVETEVSRRHASSMTARWSDPHRLPGPLLVATPGTPAPSAKA